MNTEATPPTREEMATLVADGRSFSVCSCGFIIVSADDLEVRWTIENHPCPHRPPSVPKSTGATVVGSITTIIVLGMIMAFVLLFVGAL